MPSRIRPTVPHSGALPHREHRSDSTRNQEYRRARASRMMKHERLKAIIEDEIAQEIRDANEKAAQ